MDKRPDYLNLAPHERRTLTQDEQAQAQKADHDPLQIPLVLGERPFGKFIRPRAVCDGCGLDIVLDTSQVYIIKLRKCPECGSKSFRIQETWE